MISVLMSIYNKENFLQQGVESILNQTMSDWELILVDDGSKDSSSEICDRLAEGDSRIRVFHNENSGMSGARLFGLQQARGEWVCIMDADDVAAPNLLERLTGCMEARDAQILSGTIRILETEDPEETKRILAEANPSTEGIHTPGSVHVYTGPQMACEAYHPASGKPGYTEGMLIGKLIRREFLLEVLSDVEEVRAKFPYNYFDELYLIPRLFLQATKIVLVEEDLYFWRTVADSSSHRLSFGPFQYEQILVSQDVIEYYLSMNARDAYKDYLPDFYLNMLKSWYACEVGEDDPETAAHYKEIIEDYYDRYLDDVLTAKYLDTAKKIVIKLFKSNRRLWIRLMNIYFGKAYKYRFAVKK